MIRLRKKVIEREREREREREKTISYSKPYHSYIITTAFGLRDARAYVLIFDLLCPDSFDYIEGLYAQISENREESPIIVVGNKTDKVHRNLSTSRMRYKRQEREEFKKSQRGINS